MMTGGPSESAIRANDDGWGDDKPDQHKRAEPLAFDDRGDDAPGFRLGQGRPSRPPNKGDRSWGDANP